MDRVPESYRPLIERTRAALAGKGPKTPADRNAWAEGLGLADPAAEPVDVVFFAGCRYSLEESLRETVRTQVRLLQLAGLSVGLFEDGCCGGLADKMGYAGEAAEAGNRMLAQWAAAGVKTVVTPCADCRHVFTRLYPQLEGAREHMPQVLHTVECVDQLIQDERLELTTPVPMTVTYHDPCHLGRQGEPYVPWEGVEKKIYGQAVVYDPPRPRYNGANGVYQAPRDILSAIPGLELVEMERIREAAWCCGAGGACREAYPEFSAATAAERVEEAASTGAEALVTACPRCELNFSEAVAAAPRRAAPAPSSRSSTCWSSSRSPPVQERRRNDDLSSRAGVPRPGAGGRRSTTSPTTRRSLDSYAFQYLADLVRPEPQSLHAAAGRGRTAGYHRGGAGVVRLANKYGLKVKPTRHRMVHVQRAGQGRRPHPADRPAAHEPHPRDRRAEHVRRRGAVRHLPSCRPR